MNSKYIVSCVFSKQPPKPTLEFDGWMNEDEINEAIKKYNSAHEHYVTWKIVHNVIIYPSALLFGILYKVYEFIKEVVQFIWSLIFIFAVMIVWFVAFSLFLAPISGAWCLCERYVFPLIDEFFHSYGYGTFVSILKFLAMILTLAIAWFVGAYLSLLVWELFKKLTDIYISKIRNIFKRRKE